MSEWTNCPKCGTLMENLCACPTCEPHLSLTSADITRLLRCDDCAPEFSCWGDQTARCRKNVVEQSPEPADPEPCDHDWQIRDDSFDHEFGTEVVVCWECEKCGEQKPYRAGDSNFDP